MNSFLDRIWFGNEVRDYLWVLGIILFVLFLNRFIAKYIAVLLCKLFKRQWKTFDQQKFIDLILHPLGTFLVISITIAALYRLNYPAEFNFRIYKYNISQVLLSIAVAIQVIAFIWLLLRIIDFIASVLEIKANETPYQGDNQLIVFFRDFFKVVIGIIGVMMVLHFAFNFNIGSMLTGLSIVGAAIALSLRESLENLIASFVIFFDKPFVTGDFVKVQSVSGTVERIGLRSTRVRTVDKSYVTVPNKQMVDSILDNISLRSQIRGTLDISLHPDTPQTLIQTLIARIREHISEELRISAHTVLLNDIRINTFVVFVEFFTPNIPGPEFLSIKERLNVFVLQNMEELEIKVARIEQ